MNRRAVITGAAAFAASAAVPLSLAAIRPHYSAEAYEFARIVMAMPAAKQALLAAMVREMSPDPLIQKIADVIDALAVQNGWVRGEQWQALVKMGRVKMLV